MRGPVAVWEALKQFLVDIHIDYVSPILVNQ